MVKTRVLDTRDLARISVMTHKWPETSILQCALLTVIAGAISCEPSFFHPAVSWRKDTCFQKSVKMQVRCASFRKKLLWNRLTVNALFCFSILKKQDESKLREAELLPIDIYYNKLLGKLEKLFSNLNFSFILINLRIKFNSICSTKPIS